MLMQAGQAAACGFTINHTMSGEVKMEPRNHGRSIHFAKSMQQPFSKNFPSLCPLLCIIVFAHHTKARRYRSNQTS